MQNNPEIPSPASAPASGAGATLRAAREAAGIEVVDLARRIRLEPKLILALESEAWDQLAGPAFIKGYIRSVARELGLDPTTALAQYNAQARVTEPTLADFESRAPVELTSANLWVKAVSYTLVVVLLALVAVWWQRHYERTVAPPSAEGLALEEVNASAPDSPPPSPETETEPSIAGPTLPDSNPPPLDGSSPTQASDVLLPAAIPPAAIPPAATPPAAIPPAAIPSAAIPSAAIPSAATPSAATPPAATPSAATPPAATPPAATPPAATPPAVTPPAAAKAPDPAPELPTQGELVVNTTRDSWVDIKDARGQRLWSGTLKKGKTVAVTGRPPYALLIGNAPGVTLSFRGNPVDVQSHALSGVARLSVGESP
jgi:cytoskeleton protein RodZ